MNKQQNANETCLRISSEVEMEEQLVDPLSHNTSDPDLILTSGRIVKSFPFILVTMWFPPIPYNLQVGEIISNYKLPPVCR